MGCIYTSSTLHWMIQLVELHRNVKGASTSYDSLSDLMSDGTSETLYNMGPVLLSISVRIFDDVVKNTNY
jgi:hypothetical protein